MTLTTGSHDTFLGHMTISMQDIVLRLHTNPRKIFGIREQPETYVDVDIDEEWEIPTALPHSRARWTPFAGRRVVGRVKRVVLRGEMAYIDGKVSPSRIDTPHTEELSHPMCYMCVCV